MRQNDGRRAPTRRGPARLAPFAAFALAGLLAAAAGAQERPDAAERTVTLEDQTGIALTIYNENLALVRDRRRVVLDSGPSRLAFLGLSQQIRPETALLGAEGGLTVVEQTFRPGLLGPERLLETYVGETVRLVRTHPETGEERVEEAVLLSAAGPVLRVGDRVEIDPPGRIVLPAVPEGLRAQPSLVALVEGGGAGETPVELRYLTGGLSWQTDYVAELDPDEDRLSLRGWITLANGSGASYRNARISLVAGDVNQVQPYLMHDAARTVTMEMAAAPAPKREALFDYHLYRLDRPVTLGENETKQVALLSAENVPVEKEYRFVGLNQMYDHRAGEPRRASAVVRLSFENAKAAGLGLPMPQGIVRVYGGDSAGDFLFLGEDRIDHTPEGETLRLELGRAFDVTARSRQTAFERLGEQAFETAFAVELRNAKPQPVNVTVVEQIPGEWEIVEESHPHERSSARQAEWRLEIPANGRVELTYRARVRY